MIFFNKIYFPKLFLLNYLFLLIVLIITQKSFIWDIMPYYYLVTFMLVITAIVSLISMKFTNGK